MCSRIGGWRMTRSAWTRWTLYIIESYVYKGGSPREGGPNILSDWRLADFFWGSWRLFFSSLFSTSFFDGFLVDFGEMLAGFWSLRWKQNRCKIVLKSRSKQTSIFTSFFFDVERFESWKISVSSRRGQYFYDFAFLTWDEKITKTRFKH